MKVGDLKKALNRMPPDMDDVEIMVVTGFGGERQYDALAAVGYLPLEEHTCVAVVGTSEIQRQVVNGMMEKPAGYIEPAPEPGEEWKQG